MSAEKSGVPSNGVIVLAVIAIMVMVVVFGVFGMMSQSEDPLTRSHDYVLEGSHDGSPVTGSGSTHYFNEGGSEYIYTFELKCSDSSVFSETLIMDARGNLAGAYDSLVHEGRETVENRSSEHWSYNGSGDLKGAVVDVWVGDRNTVLRIAVNGAGWDSSLYLADPVSEVSFSESVVQVTTGVSKYLAPSLFPSHAPVSGMVWDSSDHSVVTVDQDGTVRAVGAVGSTCTVTVTVNGCTASVPVIVVA